MLPDAQPPGGFNYYLVLPGYYLVARLFCREIAFLLCVFANMTPLAAVLLVLPIAHAWSGNGQALTPPLGFSSWNYRHACTTGAMMRPQVEAMVAKGLVAAGYTMVRLCSLKGRFC